MRKWSPLSWRNCFYPQAIHYPNLDALNTITHQLSNFPPLVAESEVENLKKLIAKASRGEIFILQGGDCAESFDDCNMRTIRKKLTILFQMGLILQSSLKKPVVCVGRIAGQYTKPRSLEYETIKNVTLLSYRGDLVNTKAFNLLSRIPNPELMFQGYHHAYNTLGWIKDFFKNKLINFFTSHEALHLFYEEALTRSSLDTWYNLSTHLPWIGVRTGILEGAHVEFLRGVQNPIGLKIGATANYEWLVAMIKRLNPLAIEGKLILITRMGVNEIETNLPPLIKAVKKINIPVMWMSDPMHGNTKITAEGVKTRYFTNIVEEFAKTAIIHKTMKSCLAGVHLELTGENVTECIGGLGNVDVTNLHKAYYSLVDPRLNYVQSLQIASLLSGYLL